ncbi:hypothetical protein ACXZ1M_05785 [Duganella sp. PWIR1]
MELITCKLLKMYVGEERSDHLEWHMGNGPVRYPDLHSRRAYPVQIADARLWDAAGKPLDTGEADVIARSGGRAIYVLDAHGNLYCSVSSQYYKFHHSSLVAGSAVACAGEIEVVNGVVIYVNNRSGHYRPSFLHIMQFCDYLKKRGVDCSWMEKFEGDCQS